jgi:NADH-quinone oxidoreductase subunit C
MAKHEKQATANSNIDGTQSAQAAAGEGAGPEQPAADIAPPTTGERLPAAPGTTPDPVVMGERTGMFGARDTGDTSGYGGLVRPVLFPAAAVRPFGGYFDEIADLLEKGLVGGQASYAEAVESVVVDRGELTLFVRREHLPAVARTLRDHPGLRFEICTGVSGVHYPTQEGRELHAVYHFLSITHGGRRVRVEVTAPDSDPHIPSIVETYPANDWHERETWDMFGIQFDGHPSLTRILMPDDWPGHPQRKDYPLGGIPVEYKGATIPPPDQRRSYI